ncbi:DUF5939 domain-containing protein [Mesorhizobium sp. M0587]
MKARHLKNLKRLSERRRQPRYRFNALAFARDRAIAEPEAIDLFLHAARCGLFDMSYVLCPQSGMVLNNFGALRTLQKHYVGPVRRIAGTYPLASIGRLGTLLTSIPAGWGLQTCIAHPQEPP